MLATTLLPTPLITTGVDYFVDPISYNLHSVASQKIRVHSSVSRHDGYEAASVEEVELGFLRVETSLAHKFEGFYLQAEPLKIYEDAFKEQAAQSAQQPIPETALTQAPDSVPVEQGAQPLPPLPPTASLGV